MIQLELSIAKQRHIALFDAKNQFISSFRFRINQKQRKQDAQQGEPPTHHPHIIMQDDEILTFQLFIQNDFTFTWQSAFLNIKQDQENNQFYGDIPFSLQTFLLMYRHPCKIKFLLQPKQNITKQMLLKQDQIGKLIIQTSFKSNPFILPVRSFIQSQKIINIIFANKDIYKRQFAFCSGELISQEYDIQEVTQFQHSNNILKQFGYSCFTYRVSSIIQSKHICIYVGDIQQKKQIICGIQVIFMTPKLKFFSQFPPSPPNLKDYLFKLSNIMQLKSIVIMHNVRTNIRQAQGIVFYQSNSHDFYQRIFRSFLYSKIKDEWIIHGMVYYKANSRYLHQKWNELCELVTKGQEFFPLIEGSYGQYDQVWQVKSIVMYQIMANLTHQYQKLANVLLSSVKSTKMTTKNFIRTIKNKHGIQHLKPFYLQQFINRTGITKIYYEFYPVKRQNKIKIKLRQKSLQAVNFENYNQYRIILQSSFNCRSPLILKIIQKNNLQNISIKLQDMKKKKQLTGPLLVPAILKSNAFIKKGKLPIVISQTNQQQFQQQEYQIKLQKQKITKEFINCRGKLKKVINKKSQLERQGSKLPTWMKVDPFHTFLFCSKNQNLKDSRQQRDNRRAQYIIQKQLSLEKNQMQLMKVIQSIKDSKYFHKSSLLTNKLCTMLQMSQTNPTSLCVRQEILSIFPTILSASQDKKPWDCILFLLKLYQPICYDKSLDGHQLKLSILECLSRLKYRKQYSTYFEQFHRILLSISQQSQNLFSLRQQLDFRKQLYKAMIKWKTKYTIQVLKQVQTMTVIYEEDIIQNFQILQILIQRTLKYIQTIQLDQNNSKGDAGVIQRLKKLFRQIIKYDPTNRLYLCEFSYNISKKQKQMNILQFFIYFYQSLEVIRVQKFPIYQSALKIIKDLLLKNKKKYALQMQITLINPDQNYYIAQRLWQKMTSNQSLYFPGIRLLWMKIYRIFYFYFTPICTIHKLRNNGSQLDFYALNITQLQRDQILANLKDFTPDIEWFSGYDISYNKKTQFMKQQDKQDNDRHERKKQKIPRAQLNLAQNNIMARFIRDNPDKDVNWIQLSKRALDIIIESHENKNTKMEIINQLRGIKKKLKRGNMPKGYTFQDLQEQAIRVLQDGDQDTDKIKQLFQYSKNILQKVVRQHNTIITLPADIILGITNNGGD